MSDNRTPQERSLAARIAAHESWAKTTDRPARTSAARAALEEKFLREAGGDPVRAEHLRRSYFARLALTSARARRLAAALLSKADAAEAHRDLHQDPADGDSEVTS